ncbi:hypothetical protein HALLA_07630 [Halostagnicola larsenii XH-48]|uniref:Uncharacterized protein n=1 Tax=Halostagnicola larsenii XH-48 TaxID=797299 RepID=W0JJ35_9EURY|nr:hypothetical protein [Halostagnicola larsenii]AHF98745.1 hypothetical protein HALLA_07630 [Halostagnicola larsenii XH-48]
MSTKNTRTADETDLGEHRMTTERRILRHLAERGPLDVVDLATALEDHPMTVELACERLHEKERVRLIGTGRYRLVERETVGEYETVADNEETADASTTDENAADESASNMGRAVDANAGDREETLSSE